MRASRISRISGYSLVAFFPSSVAAHAPYMCYPKSPGSGSSLCSDSSSRSASRGGFPSCKTARYFTPPSVSASDTATPPSSVACCSPWTCSFSTTSGYRLVILHHRSLCLWWWWPHHGVEQATPYSNRPGHHGWCLIPATRLLRTGAPCIPSPSSKWFSNVLRCRGCPWRRLSYSGDEMPAKEGWQLCHPSQIHRELLTPAGCCSRLQHHQAQAASAWLPYQHHSWRSYGLPLSATHGFTTTPSPSRGSYPLSDTPHQRGHTPSHRHTTWAAGGLFTSTPGCPNHCGVTAAIAVVTIEFPVQTSSNVGFPADHTKHKSTWLNIRQNKILSSVVPNVTRPITSGTSPALPAFASWNGVVNGKLPELLTSKNPQQSQHLPVLLLGSAYPHFTDGLLASTCLPFKGQ